MVMKLIECLCIVLFLIVGHLVAKPDIFDSGSKTEHLNLEKHSIFLQIHIPPPLDVAY